MASLPQKIQRIVTDSLAYTSGFVHTPQSVAEDIVLDFTSFVDLYLFYALIGTFRREVLTLEIKSNIDQTN
jgi:hypothetical protein